MSKQPIGRFIVILGPQAIYVGYINYTVEGTEIFQRQKKNPPKKPPSKLKRKEI